MKCETCRHWEGPESEDQEHGRCNAIPCGAQIARNGDAGQVSKYPAFIDYVFADVMTKPDFFCALYQDKAPIAQPEKSQES